MMKNRSLTLSLLCTVLAISLWADQRPSWVDSIPNRPDLLQGIGVAENTGNKEDALQKADNFAISQIIHEISTQVSSQISDYYQESSQDGITSKTEVLTRISSQYAAETIKGIRIKDRYYDEKEKVYYSYAILSREELKRQFLEREQNAVKYCQDYHKQAQKALSEGHIYDAIQAYVKALNELFIVQAGLRKQIKASLDGSDSEELLQARLETELLPLVRQISFENLSGSGQKAERNRGFNDPLKGTVNYNGKPLANIPLHFTFVNGAGKISENVSSDANGNFTAYVESVESSQAAVGRIQVSPAFPDLEAFREQVPELFALLESVHGTFTYQIDVAASVKIFVHVLEIADNTVTSGNTTNTALIRTLIKNKYTVMDLRRIASKIPASDLEFYIEYNDIDGLIGALSEHVDYAIVGTLTATAGDVSSGVLYFSRCDADVRIIDIKNGRIVGNSSRQGVKGAGNSFDASNKRALQECSNLVVSDILSALQNALR